MTQSGSSSADDEAKQAFSDSEVVTPPQPAEPASPASYPPADVTVIKPLTEIVPHPATEVVPPGQPTQTAPPHPPTVAGAFTPAAETVRPGPAAEPVRPGLAPEPVRPGPAPETVLRPGLAPETVRPGFAAADTVAPGQAPGVVPLAPIADVVRYGPGVPVSLPASAGGRTAEQVWRGGQQPAPGPRRPVLRRLAGSALTVILLAASGVVLYQRFHHVPVQVTGVAITRRAAAGCGVQVTGQITTNGGVGTVTYRWLFSPGQQQPAPLKQSVSAGQKAVYVTVAVEGTGHGSASQKATLQILDPDRRAASATVSVSC